MHHTVILAGFLLCLSSSFGWKTKTDRSFRIDPESGSFLKDGAPFRYVSGSLHYFRVHPSSWADRLAKLRYAGLNAVSTYVEWASHEPEPGQYDFSGGLDLVEFIEEAQRQDLLVILRVGPYICAERDMGGLPYWLLRQTPFVRLRSNDPSFMGPVRTWLLGGLFPRVKPLLYENGGPIILVQTENEYGNYFTCDFHYTAALRRVFREGLGPRALLFTTDNWRTDALRCAVTPGVYATVDFGPEVNASAAFEVQALFEPWGPRVNSEYYTGWIDHWGERHNTKTAQEVASGLDAMLALDASVNFYVFHGGSNFGFSAGANDQKSYKSVPTSYDYDAPISEAGDLTEKYWAIRDVVGKYLPLPDGPGPANTTKAAYGTVPLQHAGHHLALAAGGLLPSRNSTQPLTFEELSVFNGLVAYTTVIPIRTFDPDKLEVGSANDRTQVFVNGKYVGITSRSLRNPPFLIRTSPGDVLTLLVESLGRITVGNGLNDVKGLTSRVKLGSHVLKNWTMTPFPLDYSKLEEAVTKLRLQKLLLNRCCTEPSSECFEYFYEVSVIRRLCNLEDTGSAGFYTATFNITSKPMDTFLKMPKWKKGIAWVNGFNLGRYWPVVGPQLTLYVPRAILREGANALLLLELEGAQCSQDCSVEFVDTPEIDASVPK